MKHDLFMMFGVFHSHDPAEQVLETDAELKKGVGRPAWPMTPVANYFRKRTPLLFISVPGACWAGKFAGSFYRFANNGAVQLGSI